MAGRLEAVKNYLGGVGKRTLGTEAHRKWLAEFPTTEPTGILPRFAQFFQLLAPAAHRLADDEKFDFPPAITIPGALVLDTALVTGSIALAATTSSNPAEFIAYFAASKLAANAATHISLDLAGSMVDKIRHLKPPSVTIAI